MIYHYFMNLSILHDITLPNVIHASRYCVSPTVRIIADVTYRDPNSKFISKKKAKKKLQDSHKLYSFNVKHQEKDEKKTDYIFSKHEK